VNASSTHTVVVEAPPTAAGTALAEQTAGLGECTVEHDRDGTMRITLEYAERGGRRTSVLSEILTTMERWLRSQPVPAVTIWVDGRRFSLTQRNVLPRATAAARVPVLADALRTRRRPDQPAARTASS
jgi:hypothetical protein